MNNEIGLEQILAKVLEEMKEEAGESFCLERINLAEVGRRTGISRARLRTWKRNGCKVLPHGNTGKSHPEARKLRGYEESLDGLLKKGVTNARVCYDRLMRLGYTGSLSTVKRYIAAHPELVKAPRCLKPRTGNRGRRYTTGPGVSYQMDWGFVKVEEGGILTGRLACFAMVCHHCGLRYVEFFTNARRENLFIGMIHAFQVMGIPQHVLTDNMSTVVIGRDAEGKPVWNVEYKEFMQALGFETRLCKPRHPYTKGAVERLVGFMKHNFLAGRTFSDLTDLNRQALEWCEEKNRLQTGGRGLVPAETHPSEPLRGLPEDMVLLPYLAPLRKVDSSGFIHYEDRLYGLPHEYPRTAARVMRSGEKLLILDAIDPGLVIAEHDVDWAQTPHACPGQWAEAEPEERPTAPVTVTVHRQDAPGRDRFARFDD